MKKLKYIKVLEKKGIIFSSIEFPPFEGKFISYLKTKNLESLYENMIMSLTGEIKYKRVLFKTQQDFYLDVKDTGEIDKWGLTIYYNPIQNKELFLFVSQFNKQYKIWK